ncbi:MAG: hypothetical protein GY716_25825 [bacterium]|nr:hypothetical protein [bacterium]
MRTRNRMQGWILIVAVTVLAAVPAQAGSSWTDRSSTADPPARSGARMAYDAARGEVVMFGGGVGSAASQLFDDTWIRSGGSWTELFPVTAPAARSNFQMAYDTGRQEILLFGGFDGTFNQWRDETWVWNGVDWTLLSPAVSPVGRADGDMVYDIAREEIVLFGGFVNGPSPTRAADTWVWDGVGWIERSPATSPSGRVDHAMAYDILRGEIVLFGGSDGTQILSDTWIWDGVDWSQRFVPGPPPRADHQLAFDARSGLVILFGGQQTGGNDPQAGTWAWDGTAWAELAPELVPPSRLEHAMAADADSGTVVVFGGFQADRLGDTWTWAATIDDEDEDEDDERIDDVGFAAQARVLDASGLLELDRRSDPSTAEQSTRRSNGKQLRRPR